MYKVKYVVALETTNKTYKFSTVKSAASTTRGGSITPIPRVYAFLCSTQNNLKQHYKNRTWEYYFPPKLQSQLIFNMR